MKKAIFGSVLFFFSMVLVCSTTSVSAQAKAKKTVVIKSKAVEANRGTNPNIKSDVPTKDKQEAKNRAAAACSIYFDNFTGYYVKVYVDGDYKGTVGPYDSGTVTVGDGYTTIYCITSGGTKEWSATGNCTDSFYRFKLNN